MGNGNDNEENPMPTTSTGVDLSRFNLRVECISELDDQGEPCDRANHWPDDDGRVPEVEAQAYYFGLRDGDPYFVSGCLDCVREEIYRDANGDRLTVIEMEH